MSMRLDVEDSILVLADLRSRLQLFFADHTFSEKGSPEDFCWWGPRLLPRNLMKAASRAGRVFVPIMEDIREMTVTACGS